MTEISDKAISNSKLGTEKISKLVSSFFATSLVGLLLNTIYNLTDTLFVSWGVGDFAMGGVSIVAPFVFLQGAISTMIGGGAASLVSRKLGENDPESAGKITLHAMVLFYTIAIITTVIGFALTDPILRLLGATTEIFPYAKDYFCIILSANIFSTGFSSIIRAEGKNLYAMLIWVVPITINIILDAVFILGLKWGVKGSAFATFISQFVGFIICILFFTKFSTQRFRKAKFDLKKITAILKIGLPSLCQMGGLSIIIAILNVVLGAKSGSSAIISFGYLNKLIFYFSAPIMALTQALAPIVGYNHGLQQHERVDKAIQHCLKLSALYVAVVVLIIEIFPSAFIMIFTNDSAIIAEGAIGLRIAALALFFMPLPTILAAKMQATGNPVWALILYSANVVFIIAPAILLGNQFGIAGAMWSFVIANACASLLAMIKLQIDKRKNCKPQNTPD